MTERLWFAGARVAVHVSGAALGVWESWEPRGSALPPHVHTREDEQLILLEGEVTIRVGDATHELRGGDALALPRGVPHAHEVTSETARIMTIATPGGFERLFLDLGTPDPAPPDFEAMVAAVRKLGVERV